MNNKRRTDGKLLTLRFDGVIICPEGRGRKGINLKGTDRRTQSAEHKERKKERKKERREETGFATGV